MHSHLIFENICRVCGYNDTSVRWENYSGELIPHYIICSCCGVESGLEDSWIDGIKSYRDKWRNTGYKWKYEKEKPADWDL